MGEMTDRYFLRPRAAFTAHEIDVQDAINLVVYAKLPLKSRLTGKALIAGSVLTDRAGHSIVRDGESLKRKLSPEFEQAISALRYPVGPSDYEPLLIEMLETGFDELPFFVHDHNLIVDRRWRAAHFLKLYDELQQAVLRGQIKVRWADAQQTYILTADSWMSERTLMSYLNQQQVKSWWEVTSNLNSHDRLERLLINDAPQLREPNDDVDYDTNEVPSFLFAEMLLRRTHERRDLSGVLDAGSTAKPSASIKSDPEFASSYFQPGKRHRAEHNLGATTADAPYVREAIVPETLTTPQEDSAHLVERSVLTATPTTLSVLPSKARDRATKGAKAHLPPQSVESTSGPLPRGKATPKRDEDSAHHDDDLLSRTDIAEWLGTSLGTVDNYRKKPDFPKHIKVGGMPRWKRSALMRWLDANEG